MLGVILFVFDNKCYFALNYISVSSSAALMCWQAYALTLKCRCILTQDVKNCCTMCQQLCQQALHKIWHSISLWFYPSPCLLLHFVQRSALLGWHVVKIGGKILEKWRGGKKYKCYLN